MPRRSTLLQRIVFVAKRNLVDTDAVVTESKMLPDLDDGQLCEVDVVIEATVAGEPVVVSVEVKEESRPLDKNAVTALIGKHHRLPTNRLVIVSKSGFSKRALLKVAASDGKVAAVTPADVELARSPTLVVESYTMTAKDDVVLVVRKPNGELVKVRSPHGEGVDIYGEDGTVEASLEGLLRFIMNAPGPRKRMAHLFHDHEKKEDVWGFAFEMPDFDELPGMPPLFVKWSATNEFHQIVGLAFGGDFKGYQSTLDFKGWLLGEQTFGVAHGVLIGRPTVWVARQLDEAQARISWHFLDAPPGA
jgi:hypothetical protein